MYTAKTGGRIRKAHSRYANKDNKDDTAPPAKGIASTPSKEESAARRSGQEVNLDKATT